MMLHSSITAERVEELIQEADNGGLCIECGAERSNCEPDAERYLCENCGQRAVYGAEQLLLMTDLPMEG